MYTTHTSKVSGRTAANRFLTSIFAVVPILVLIVGGLQTGDRARCADPPIPEKSSSAVVGIQTSVSKSKVIPGEEFFITDLAPDSTPRDMRGIWHTIYKIGSFDPKIDALVNFKVKHYLLCRNEDVCDDLPVLLMYFHDDSYTITTPRSKGFERKFKFTKLGIYQIQTRWTFSKDDRNLDAAPIIIVVAPPVGKDGKSIIKKEWLD